MSNTLLGTTYAPADAGEPAILKAMSVEISSISYTNSTAISPHFILLQQNPEGDWAIPSNLSFGNVSVTVTPTPIKKFKMRCVNLSGVTITHFTVTRTLYPGVSVASLANDYTLILDTRFPRTVNSTTWANLPTDLATLSGLANVYNDFPVTTIAPLIPKTFTFTTSVFFSGNAMDEYEFSVAFKPKNAYTAPNNSRIFQISFYGYVGTSGTIAKLGGASPVAITATAF